MPKNAPFDRSVDDYEAWFQENPLAYASEILAVRKLVPPAGRVLEVGVGSGRFAGPMRVPFGLDPSIPMLQLARKRGARVLAGAGETLPVRDGSLDGVLLVTALCYLDDPARALAQARRALKPGGSLVCAFIDAESPLGRQYRERQAESSFYRDARLLAAGEVGGLLEQAGFAVRETVQTLTGPPDRLREPEPPRKGSGQGGFVVVRAVKGERKAPPAIN
jgi:SAM-dependent methyltransferase